MKNKIRATLEKRNVMQIKFYRSMVEPPFVFGTFKMYYYGKRRPSVENAKYLQNCFKNILGEELEFEELLPIKGARD